MEIMEGRRIETHQVGASQELKSKSKRQIEIVRVEKLYTQETFEVPRIARALIEVAEYFETRLAELRVQNRQTASIVCIGNTGCLAGYTDGT